MHRNSYSKVINIIFLFSSTLYLRFWVDKPRQFVRVAPNQNIHRNFKKQAAKLRENLLDRGSLTIIHHSILHLAAIVEAVAESGMLGSQDRTHWLHTNSSVAGAGAQALAEVGLKGVLCKGNPHSRHRYFQHTVDLPQGKAEPSRQDGTLAKKSLRKGKCCRAVRRALLGMWAS